MSQLSIEGSDGVGYIGEYEGAKRQVVQAYVDALGRYPDPAAMKEQVGLCACNEEV
jgi:hypothetical protein